MAAASLAQRRSIEHRRRAQRTRKAAESEGVTVDELHARSRLRRAHRLHARNVLRKITNLPRVRDCGWKCCDEGGVNVKISGTAETGRVAGFSGVASCGSVWACPVCAEIVQARRRAELIELCSVAAARGCTVVLATLTMRHNRGDSLAELWADLSDAWNAVNGNGSVRATREAFGYVGHVRAVEVTVGPAGWHVHAHVLYVLDWHGGDEHDEAMPDEVAAVFGEALWRPWQRHLSDRPNRAPVREAFDVRVGRGALDRMGEYLAKAEFRTSWQGLAAEATMSAHKKGRKDNRTPFEVLADIVDRTDELTGPAGQTLLVADPDDLVLAADLKLWAEWEAGSKGRRQLEWSRATKTRPSLREWAGLGDEVDDEEIVEADELGGDSVVQLPQRTWIKVRARTAELLDVAEIGGLEALAAWLDAAGLAWFDLSRPPTTEDRSP